MSELNLDQRKNSFPFNVDSFKISSSKKPKAVESAKPQLGFNLERPSRLLNSSHFPPATHAKGYLFLKSSQGKINERENKEGSRLADVTPRQKTGKKERPDLTLARKKTARKNRRHAPGEKYPHFTRHKTSTNKHRLLPEDRDRATDGLPKAACAFNRAHSSATLCHSTEDGTREKPEPSHHQPNSRQSRSNQHGGRPSVQLRKATSATKVSSNQFRKSFRSSGNQENRFKNPTLKKIIENLKEKIKEQDVEQKIHDYLDFLDSNVTGSKLLHPLRHLEYIKTKRSKRDQTQDSVAEVSSKQQLIDKKMAEIKVSLELFSRQVKLQSEENCKLRRLLADIAREQRDPGESGRREPAAPN